MADKLELDALTGKNVERGYTADEQAQRAKDEIKHIELAQAEADRKALKAATIAKLGLTPDEVAALLS